MPLLTWESSIVSFKALTTWSEKSCTQEIAFLRASHPLPLTPSRTTRIKGFLFVTNFVIFMDLPLLLKQISIKWVLVLPLIFRIKPLEASNSTAFFKCSDNHSNSSFPKPIETTNPRLLYVIEIQVPPLEPSNFTWKAFFSTSKNFAIFYLLLFSIKNGNSPIFPKGAILLSPSHPPQNGLKSVFRRTTSSWNIGHINHHEKGQLSCSLWLDVTAKIFSWINPSRNRSLLILETIKHMENTLRTLALYIGGQYLRRE